jgi:hypothetical protein
MLRDFCQANGINEVYVSVSANSGENEDARLVHLIELLHGLHVRVDAVLSSTDADQPARRDAFLSQVNRIREFNRRNPANRFDGLHLDIEPELRPENKETGSLKFLPDLVATYAAVRGLAETANLDVMADVHVKLLKGSQAQRTMLLSALPRFAVMMYEVSRPADGASTDQMADQVRKSTKAILDQTFEGLDAATLGQLVIGVRTQDYGKQLPRMLDVIQESNRDDPRYGGWAVQQRESSGAESRK